MLHQCAAGVPTHPTGPDYRHREEYHGSGRQYRNHQDGVQSLSFALFSQKNPQRNRPAAGYY